MGKRDVWMPLNVGDYLADTMRLTTLQHGAYLLLLFDYWRSGPLPDSDEQLAAVTKVDVKEWRTKIGPVVRRFFNIGEDGLLHQKRADAEIERAGRISDARRDAALHRHNKPANPEQDASKPDANAPANAPANDQQDPVQNAGIARGHAVAGPLPRTLKEDSDLRSAQAPPDARTILWQQGLPILRSLTGKSDTQARSLLGQLVGKARDDCARLLHVLLEAQSLRPVNPIAWIEKAAVPRSERGLLADEPYDPRHPTPMSGGFG